MTREMKNSGIPWIGEIPEGWETHRLKSVFASRISGEWGDDAQNDYNDRVCLRIADFEYKRLRFKHCESYTIRNYSKAEENLPYLKNGDILIEKSGGGEKTPVGRAIVYDLEFDKAMYANFMTRLRVKAQINPWFVEYMLSTLYAYGALNVYIKQTTGIQNLDITTMLEEEKIFLPSLAEQQRIAEFLDRKCAEVDEMIALQEQIIEELKAYKQSVITEAVTKGLNPAAPMRDSGIEWIGSIPEHWETKRLKHLSQVVRGGSPRPAGDERFYNGNIPFMKVADITKDDSVYVNSCEYTIKEAGLNHTRMINPNTLLLTNSGATLGVPKINTFVTTFNDGIAAFLNLDKGLDIIFAYYSLKVRTQYFLDSASLGIGQPNLNTDIIGSVYLLIPPLYEQKDIVEYLDEKCADIDSLIQTKQSKIDSLKEYKKSIIYEYVTGKREVEL